MNVKLLSRAASLRHCIQQSEDSPFEAPEPLRHALRPGDVVWGEDVAVRVARVGRGSAVGVPLCGEPQVVAVAYENVKGVVVRELEDDMAVLAPELAGGRR